MCREVGCGNVAMMGRVSQEQKMLKGHLPRVIYHQVYYYKKIKVDQFCAYFAKFEIPKVSCKHVVERSAYRSTSFMSNCTPLGPYSRPMPRMVQ